MDKREWLGIDDAAPLKVGWYPTVHCWDSYEGMFPNATYWDGAAWKTDLPIFQWICQRFEEGEPARELAYANDPEELSS